MEIVRFADLVATPWKNGGGVTREVARKEKDGAIDWRLSIADVASEGPFSVFPRMRRILTVIEGEGMQLVRPDGSFLAADLLLPVTFSGDEPINGVLPQGPCRDFNVIWNPELADAKVEVVARRTITAISPGVKRLIVCASGETRLSDGTTMSLGDFAPVGEEPISVIDGVVLLVSISPASHP